ncbi:unnamed protein product [Caenorhabditis nigoni]
MSAFRSTLLLAVTLAVANCGLIKLPTVAPGATNILSNLGVTGNVSEAVQRVLNAGSSVTGAIGGASNAIGNIGDSATGALLGAVNATSAAAELINQFSDDLVAELVAQEIEHFSVVGAIAASFIGSIASHAQAAGNIDANFVTSRAADFADELSKAIKGSANSEAMVSITADFAAELDALFAKTGNVTIDAFTNLTHEFASEIAAEVFGIVDTAIYGAVDAAVDAAAQGSGYVEIVAELAAELKAQAHGNVDIKAA